MTLRREDRCNTNEASYSSMDGEVLLAGLSVLKIYRKKQAIFLLWNQDPRK